MVAVGDRVRMTGVMENDPAPIMVGDEGTVTYASEEFGQYGVAWDSGRTLMLLRGDPFVVIGRAAARPVEWLVVHDGTDDL